MINQSGFETIDPFFIMISNKFIWIPLYLYLLYLIYRKKEFIFFKLIITLVILIFISDFGSVHLFKNQFKILRPCHDSLISQSMRHIVDCGGLYSFISSHAANSFAVAFFTSMTIKNKIFFISITSWAILISYSRVYLGVHFPLDVIFGMLWGLMASLMSYKLLIKFAKID